MLKKYNTLIVNSADYGQTADGMHPSRFRLYAALPYAWNNSYYGI